MTTHLCCPRCNEPTTWQDNAYRPFCSERCKLIDFGAWANEEYAVASQDSAPSEPTTEQDQY